MRQLRGSVLVVALVAAVAATAMAQSARPRSAAAARRRPSGTALFKEAAAREAALRRELDRGQAGRAGHRCCDACARSWARTRTRRASSPPAATATTRCGRAPRSRPMRSGRPATTRIATARCGCWRRSRRRFPAAATLVQAAPLARRLEGAPRTAATTPPAKPPPRPHAATLATPAPAQGRRSPARRREPDTAVAAGLLTAVRREVLPDAVRVTLELEREAAFHSERIHGPARVFVDLPHTRAVPALRFAVAAVRRRHRAAGADRRAARRRSRASSSICRRGASQRLRALQPVPRRHRLRAHASHGTSGARAAHREPAVVAAIAVGRTVACATARRSPHHTRHRQRRRPRCARYRRPGREPATAPITPPQTPPRERTDRGLAAAAAADIVEATAALPLASTPPPAVPALNGARRILAVAPARTRHRAHRHRPGPWRPRPGRAW